MANFGLLSAEIGSVVWASQVISTGFAYWQRYCMALQQWASAKLYGVEQRALPIFARATITLGIRPHSSIVCVSLCVLYCFGIIRGSTLALHCCKAHSQINRKMENLTPCKIVTPENFILKLDTRDYVEDVTYYTIFVTFFPVLSFSSSSHVSSNRTADIHALWLK